MLPETTTVLEQHGHRGLDAVDEGTKYTIYAYLAVQNGNIYVNIYF